MTEAVVAATQTSAASTGDQKTICDVIHPGQSCASHFVGFLPRAYMRALPVYVPIYIIPMLLVHRDKLLKKPEPPKIAPAGFTSIPRGPLSRPRSPQEPEIRTTDGKINR